jgi:hypothetical protein
MKNLHLVPVNVVDLVDKLSTKDIRENEQTNYLMRLEAIRDYTSAAVIKFQNQKPMKANTRRLS